MWCTRYNQVPRQNFSTNTQFIRVRMRIIVFEGAWWSGNYNKKWKKEAMGRKIQRTLLEKIVQIIKSIYLPDSSLSLWLMKASSSLLRWKSCAYSASVKIFQWSYDDVILKYRVRSKIGKNPTNLHFTYVTQVPYWSWGHEPAKSGKQGSININQIKNQKPVKRIQFPISW